MRNDGTRVGCAKVALGKRVILTTGEAKTRLSELPTKNLVFGVRL
jgi:hypothetical protein